MTTAEKVVYWLNDVRSLLKREHGLFPKETLQYSFTPMPSGVGVNEVFAELFSKSDCILLLKSDRILLSKKRVSPKKFEKPSYNGHILGI